MALDEPETAFHDGATLDSGIADTCELLRISQGLVCAVDRRDVLAFVRTRAAA